MKQLFKDAWLFPNCFLLFFSLYLLVKFFFIFFFRASYEPAFLFHLTPLYLLSGVSNIQLLLLSLLLMVVDLYLHLRMSKRNLLLSFLPTSLMISGVGITIMYSSLDILYILHYFIFGCLLIVVLIDYHYVLKGIDPSAVLRKKETVPIRRIQQEPDIIQKKPLFLQSAKQIKQHPVVLSQDRIVELKNVSESILQKMHIILDDLERKTLQIARLEEKLDEQQTLIHNNKIATRENVSPSTLQERLPYIEKQSVQHISTAEELVLKKKIENHLVIDEMNDIVVVVQRGIFKEVSNSFAGFLGYERTELLQKNFFVFIAPRGYGDARKYYLNRLKGVTSNSFRTILLTKTNTEVLVEITVTPTIYNGDSAEFLCIKEIKNPA